ncbi:MAG: hypothetical protein K9M44_00265 [Candidatus Pacebacteria bacterium]|nr:hypothetical protein [Candidatus Paceibacterota bacterium]
MKNLKSLIRNNLYLRVDFDNKYKKKKGGVSQSTDFFLIGVLPIAIFYKNGEQETASLSRHITVKQDPYLRNLQGIKGKDSKNIGPYKPQVKAIIVELEKVFRKIIKEGKFNNKDIDKLLVIKFTKHEKRTIDKN